VVFCVAMLPEAVPAVFHGLYPAAQASSSGAPWQSAAQTIARALEVCAVPLYLIYRSPEGWAGFGYRRPRLSDLGVGLLLTMVSIALMLLLPTARSFRLPATGFAMGCVAAQYAAASLMREVARAFMVVRFAEIFANRAIAVVGVTLLSTFDVLFVNPRAFPVLALTIATYAGFFLLRRSAWPLLLGGMIAGVFSACIR